MDDSAYHLEMFIYIPLKQPCVSDGWRHSAMISGVQNNQMKTADVYPISSANLWASSALHNMYKQL